MTSQSQICVVCLHKFRLCSVFEVDLRAREIVLLIFTSVLYTYAFECGFRGSVALTMTTHHLCFIAAVPNLFDLWTLKMNQCLPGTALDKSGEQINQRLIFFLLLS